MEGPLWIDAHAPALDEIRQDEARQRLERAVDEPMNLVVQGPPGVGKTAATRALTRVAHETPRRRPDRDQCRRLLRPDQKGDPERSPL